MVFGIVCAVLKINIAERNEQKEQKMTLLVEGAILFMTKQAATPVG
jgi:hypothetical protein